MTRHMLAIVDDNPDNLMLLEALLEDAYELTLYDSGKDALAGMAERVPSVALLDISLPGMDGTEVLASMRASATLASVPTIALTAHAMSGDREKYLGLGFNGYVSKPIVDETVLFDAITRLL